MRNFIVAVIFALIGSTLTRLFIQTGNWWFAVIFIAIIAVSSWKVYTLTRQMNAHKQADRRITHWEKSNNE